MKKFKRILVANRGEIAIRIFRACSELGIRSVAIYSEEDKTALFRTKADESYLVGKDKNPVEAYLNMDEIIRLALKKGVDAIHPGYGFLAENAEFARRCEEAGIAFIGPNETMINALGDKIQSKIVAKKAQVPTIPGVEKPIQNDREALEFAKLAGFPVMIKASAGGGGRGMRIVHNEGDLIEAYHNASSEAKKAFGVEDVFIEKYLESPKHIEVQILGDKHGNIVHLYERDCSIQRRHQKIIEFTPAISISKEKRQQICADAIKIARAVGYENAGTVEFLLDKENNHYFIEMNPRIQVEHTITEMVTGIDIVQSQILIAEGYALDSKEINIPSQESIRPQGYAIQCRVTTEDPSNDFAPDTGRIDVYRSGSGFGIRLDGGNSSAGSVISPYYDSLLVKVTSHSRTFEDAIRKSIRSLKETTVAGVKTNIGFLINVLNTESFAEGRCDTHFIAENPQLFDIRPQNDRELKLLNYLGEVIVNQTKGHKPDFDVPPVPSGLSQENLYGTKQILDERGIDGLIEWIHAQKKLLITDTTMRDAHQSLMATRVRTKDMTKIAKATSVYGQDLFSLEMWGGATFDVAYRFLHESPWRRLQELRERIPNILFQMLIRGSNAVGYKNYPDNVNREFIRESAKNGIDIFRIFDSLNWMDGMIPAIDEVRANDKIAEACICYTGDILDETRDKYNLKYYVDMAKEIEKAGSHILGIKDMSGLLKPYAASKLIRALKQEISIPIHLHTHDTSGNGVATVLMAAEEGVDIVDTAFNSMSGLTSQPALNSVVAALENTERATGIDLDRIEEVSRYWAAVRPVYAKFESDLKSGTTEVYKYEIPGGQYSNLRPQVESFGLGHRFEEVKEMFKSVNYMVGDIVKVTPSSKMVGDFAIFMMQNDLTPENIVEKGQNLTYPDSVVAYFKGMMGQPMGGFPEDIQKMVLKGEEPITVRPGLLLEDFDFEGTIQMLEEKHKIKADMKDALAFALYGKVFEDYLDAYKQYGDLQHMGSDVFFHGLKEGEMAEIEVKKGRKLVTKLLSIGQLDAEGYRTLAFEVNGNRREIRVFDKHSGKKESVVYTAMADPQNPNEIGAAIPGTIAKILVSAGEKVKQNQTLMIIEAMKMETVVMAKEDGVVKEILVKEKEQIKAGQLLVVMEG